MPHTSLFRIARVVLCISLFIVLLTQAFGADAALKRRASLRQDPSAKHPPILWLTPGDDVTLVDNSPSHGYYHVRTSEGDDGWIYGRSLQMAASTAATSTSSTTTNSTSTANSTETSSIPSDWDKPEPNQTQFDGADGTCGPSGDGGDGTTNLRKNRTDVPSSYHLVTWKAFQSLPYPVAGRSLADWTQDQLSQIQPYEGIPVSVVGYLVAIKVEDRGSGESTNCHFTNPEEVDWHMPLVEQAGQAEATAIVVETTPRVRQTHSKWTTTELSPWVNADSPVRISGWALLDPEHRAHLGKYRSTLWEVHPITKIEVFKDGQWIDADQLQ